MKNLMTAFILTFAFWPLYHSIFSGIVFVVSYYETYIEAFFDNWCIIGSLIQLPVYTIIVYANVIRKEQRA